MSTSGPWTQQHRDPATRQSGKRVALLLVLVVAAAAVAASEPLHRAVRSLIALAEPVILRHPVTGALAFVLLAALSAMVVFFSTAVITPLAVNAFGPVAALLLLWLGWILGGVTAYAIGRLFGRRVVRWFVAPDKLRDYERRARTIATFRHVLLFQLAMPSEIPGYVLGLSGCRFRTYVAGMALGELPFAIGAIYLGENFLERNYVLLLTIGIAGIALSWLAYRHASRSWPSDGPDQEQPVGLAKDHDDRDGGGDQQSGVFPHAEADRGG